MLADLKKKETIRLDLGALNSHTLKIFDKTLPRLQQKDYQVFDLQLEIQLHIEVGFHGR
jgi:hypothetical protein